MDTPSGTHQEIVVPASIFATLRREVAKEVGVLASIHALHSVGYETGQSAGRSFRTSVGGDLSTLPQEDFWGKLSGYFARRGWGSLSHQPRHVAVGVLTSRDWSEGEESRSGDDTSCSFSSGFLAGFLTELAGGPVAVLEVECRSRGDAACTFAFGAEGAIHEVYGHLVEGGNLDGALTEL